MNEQLRDYAIALTSPTAWIGMLLLLGLILFWMKRTKASKIFLSLGVILFLLFSTDPLPEYLLNKLENSYPGFELKNQDVTKIKFVVVLAGGYVPDTYPHPLSAQLSPFTIPRLIEGIKIHRELPGTKIIFTGKGWTSKSEAQAMKEMAISLGVKDEDIILDELSQNTYSHTIYLKEYVKNAQFVLVTSAIHMPRSMGFFLKAGYKPIPAPTHHILNGDYTPLHFKTIFPTGENLEAIDLVFNELSGILLGKIRGRI